MINAKELKVLTNESIYSEKLETWIQIATPHLKELLVTQAKLGKSYLHIGQNNIKWMSVPEFRNKLKSVMESHGYYVEYDYGNNMKIKW